MKLFGLTGNIGCGKSTVANIFATFPGVLTLDCDRIAKDLILDPANKKALIDIVGNSIISDGEINLSLLARIIFSDPKKKKEIEELIHPLVWAAVAKQVKSSNAEIGIVESAILYEMGSDKRFLGIIVATCSSEEQLLRLKRDRGMSEADAKLRMASQLESKEKEARAQFVISTDSDLPDLEARVLSVHQQLKSWKGALS